MLACALKNRLSSRLVSRSVSVFFQRRAFSENAESVEYEIVKNMETRKLIFYYWCPIKLLLLHCNKNIGAKSNKTVNMTAKIHGFMLKHQQRLMLIVLCKRQAFIY